MARKVKKTTQRRNSRLKSALPVASMPALTSAKKFVMEKMLNRNFLLLTALILVALFFVKNKNLLVVAIVNGRPVSRLELERRLVGRFGNQTLDEIVNEQLILQEGEKNKVVVSQKDINDKVAEIEKSLGGKISLADALAGQGLSLDEFRWQIRLQLILEKLAATDLSVSEAEISDYLEKNRAEMTATDGATLQQEAKDALISQKRSEKLRSLFQSIKSSAKVTKYL